MREYGWFTKQPQAHLQSTLLEPSFGSNWLHTNRVFGCGTRWDELAPTLVLGWLQSISCLVCIWDRGWIDPIFCLVGGTRKRGWMVHLTLWATAWWVSPVILWTLLLPRFVRCLCPALRRRGTVQADKLAEAKQFPQAPGDRYLAWKPVEVERFHCRLL